MKKLIAALLLAVMFTAMFVPALADEPAYATTRSFIATLEENDLAYEFVGKEYDDDEHVKLENEDENFAYTIHVYFDKDEDVATVLIWNIIEFNEVDYADVLRAVNNMNYSYKYTRFYIDESDNTVTCAMNIILHDNDSAGDIVLEGLLRAASILKSAYPQMSSFDR